MTEAELIAWFAAHPFLKLCASVAAGSIAASIKHDRASLATARETDPAAAFRWRVAIRNYLVGASMAVGGVVGAEILHVLGASVP